MRITQGFDNFNTEQFLLLLMRKIYIFNQKAVVLWRQLLRALISIVYKISKANQFLYIFWIMQVLVLWLSLIDGYMVIGDAKSCEVFKRKNYGTF